MTNVFAYIRVSTTKQSDKMTQDNQRKAIEDYAAANGLHIVEWFEDLGESGAKKDRPNYTLMVSRLGEVSGVITYDPDRLSRDYALGQTLMFRMAEEGKKLYVARTGQTFDYSNDSDQLVMSIMNWGAAVERKKINARQRDGIRRYKEKHGYWGPQCIKINWKMYDTFRERGLSNRAIARVFDIDQRTLMKRLRERNGE